MLFFSCAIILHESRWVFCISLFCDLFVKCHIWYCSGMLAKKNNTAIWNMFECVCVCVCVCDWMTLANCFVCTINQEYRLPKCLCVISLLVHSFIFSFVYVFLFSKCLILLKNQFHLLLFSFFYLIIYLCLILLRKFIIKRHITRKCLCECLCV